MEQLEYGDTVYWNCVNGLTHGELVGVQDNLTIICKTRNNMVVPVSVYSIKKVEHKRQKQSQ